MLLERHLLDVFIFHSTIDVPSIFIGTAAPLWVVDLEAAQGALSAVATRAPGAASDDDLLVLYENTKKLKKMHDAFCGRVLYLGLRAPASS